MRINTFLEQTLNNLNFVRELSSQLQIYLAKSIVTPDYIIRSICINIDIVVVMCNTKTFLRLLPGKTMQYSNLITKCSLLRVYCFVRLKTLPTGTKLHYLISM